ncbi:MAG: potassium channel protein [Candidatus Altiarchaeales archaeon]|nr:MAG: potassium channel protein [Candidatus Altiarchaeales archaeon]
MEEEKEHEVDEIVERAVSHGRSVKDVLIEMKNTSELMVDLAYSSLLTNSREIAEEVQRLEKVMDDLQYEIEALLLLSARNVEEAADLAGILHVALAAENIADSAEDIIDVVIRGIGDHPIYQTMISESEEQIARIVVGPNSELVNKSLGELRLSKRIGAYIRAIRRGNRWIYHPDKKTVIKEGDILIVKGDKPAIESLRAMCSS